MRMKGLNFGYCRSSLIFVTGRLFLTLRIVFFGLVFFCSCRKWFLRRFDSVWSEKPRYLYLMWRIRQVIYFYEWNFLYTPFNTKNYFHLFFFRLMDSFAFAKNASCFIVRESIYFDKTRLFVFVLSPWNSHSSQTIYNIHLSSFFRRFGELKWKFEKGEVGEKM